MLLQTQLTWHQTDRLWVNSVDRHFAGNEDGGERTQVCERVETGELGQLVSNPLWCNWRNRMRQFLLPTVCVHGRQPRQGERLCTPLALGFLSLSWSRVRLHESKLNICWETFLIIRMQWITCFAVGNLLLFALKWVTAQTRHILAQIRNEKSGKVPTLCTLFQLYRPALNTKYAVFWAALTSWQKRLFRCHSKKWVMTRIWGLLLGYFWNGGGW